MKARGWNTATNWMKCIWKSCFRSVVVMVLHILSHLRERMWRKFISSATNREKTEERKCLLECVSLHSPLKRNWKPIRTLYRFLRSAHGSLKDMDHWKFTRWQAHIIAYIIAHTSLLIDLIITGGCEGFSNI